MPSRRRIALVLATIASIWTLLHVYAGARLLAGWALPEGGRIAAWTVILGIAWIPFLGFIASRAERFPAKRALEWTGFTALGLSSLVIVFVALTNLLHLPVPGAVLLGAVAGLMVAGMLHARRPRVVRVAVPIVGLPEQLEGFRIVQLSDLHVGQTLGRKFVESVVRTANGLAPDLLALTGDVADGYPDDVRDQLQPLAALAATHGKFYVTGNHEYYWDPAGWVREVRRLGFDALLNEHRVLRFKGTQMVLAGVTDSSTTTDSDPIRALEGAPAVGVRVLLAHQPRSAYAARAAGVDLQLSGHTHGGQYFPFNILVRLFQPFVSGLHRLEEMWLYVSRGTGYWGPPLRLGAPAEITLLELTAV